MAETAKDQRDVASQAPTDQRDSDSQAPIDSANIENIEKVSMPKEADTSCLEPALESLSINPGGTNADDVYNMEYPKRGMFIVINNKTFEKLPIRKGTDVDAVELTKRFEALGFDVDRRNDLTAAGMLKVVTKVSEANHSKFDMFAMAILSHGDQGVVYGTDGQIKLDNLFAPLKGDKCQTLVGKPKFFIIQACRGGTHDAGVELTQTTDGDEDAKRVSRIPTEADFIYGYSTCPGYYSWRNSDKGSWFVQALCRVLQEFGDTRELLWILTRTNRQVAYEFESKSNKKQMPSIVSQLTKELYMKPKPK